MVNLETYYSFANILEGVNNSFNWSVDGGKTWTILHVPTGCYELKTVNAEIIGIRGNSDITILPNVNTLQCILTVVGAKCKVSFGVPNSLASVLGFKRSIYGVGRHASENLVHIILLLTPVEINQLNKAQVEGKRAQIRMSATQVAKNVSHPGGFLGMLASLAARTIPLDARAIFTILSGLTTGPLSGGINKASSAAGLYLH